MKDIYIGEWKQNKRHGYGVFKTSSGKKQEGHWANDKLEVCPLIFSYLKNKVGKGWSLRPSPSKSKVNEVKRKSTNTKRWSLSRKKDDDFGNLP